MKNSENSIIKSKKGQVTLFIIIAILLVVVILGALFLYGEKESYKPKEVGPEQFIKNCAKSVVEDKIQVLLDNGSRLNPTHFVTYKGQIYNYLCYQADYYSSCYNLYPDLEGVTEKELEESTKTEVENCFRAITEEYQDRGFTVRADGKEYGIDILPGNIKLTIRFDFEISDGETSLSFDNFDTRIASPFYDLIKVAREIVNAESRFCYFEYGGYMLLYPQFDIKRISYDTSRLYWIKDRRSGNEFKFAVRSCAGKSGI
jgi:hypothetical protein